MIAEENKHVHYCDVIDLSFMVSLSC
eukprot:SAG31_NODE_10054_length_1190_cov_1.765353_1_plen_25_part_10